jgi:transposase-like protein
VEVTARSLAELRCQLPTERHCRGWIEGLRWPDGRFCPHCGGLESWPITGPSARDGLYECKACRRQFTATTRTPLHSTKLPLRVWIEAMCLVLTSSKGMASVALARFIGVSQKTEWKMGHAIRLLMAEGARPRFAGTVEADEKYVGGRPRKRTDGIKAKRGKGTRKTPVLVIVERCGAAAALPLVRESAAEIGTQLNERVDPAATLMTDGSSLYRELGRSFADHRHVDHTAGEYARKDPDGAAVHNNTAESLNAMIERARFGVFHSMSRPHLHRYLAEVTFRWNQRHPVRRHGYDGPTITMEPTPFGLRAAALLSRAFGRQIRRTPNGGLSVPAGSG